MLKVWRGTCLMLSTGNTISFAYAGGAAKILNLIFLLCNCVLKVWCGTCLMLRETYNFIHLCRRRCQNFELGFWTVIPICKLCFSSNLPRTPLYPTLSRQGLPRRWWRVWEPIPSLSAQRWCSSPSQLLHPTFPGWLLQRAPYGWCQSTNTLSRQTSHKSIQVCHLWILLLQSTQTLHLQQTPLVWRCF